MAATKTNAKAVAQLLSRGVETVEVKAHLAQRLESGDKLRVKFGVDPTGADLHLGHAVVLYKLRQWQDLGHQVILLIGDFTATIGDPSGRNDARPMLTPQQIEANWASYAEQAGKILDMAKVEVRYNHEWYSQWSLAQLLELYAKFTVQRVLERDDFAKRMQAGGELSMLELSYPMLQGFDSFELHADVELGGSDQLFNMLMGRKVQKRLGQEPQDVMAMPLIEGTDGVRKMSKSYNNYIALNDAPADMFGKLMSVPDELIGKYLELVTLLSEDEMKEISNQQSAGDPKGAKVAMAIAVTAGIHGAEAAAAAAARFDSVHAKGQTPEDISEYHVGAGAALKAVLAGSGLASSGSEAQRLIEQGAVKVDGKAAAGINELVQPGQVIQVGPHRFLRLT